ncbi:hypothetical protein ACQ4LE_005006 [Meloidogyne hapla]
MQSIKVQSNTFSACFRVLFRLCLIILIFSTFYLAFRQLLHLKRMNKAWEEDSKHLRNFTAKFKNMEHQYSLQKPSKSPCNNDTKVFILVLSRRESYINREAIRLTWLKYRPNGTVLRFFLADENVNKNHPGDFKADPDKITSSKLNKFIRKEHNNYDDTVFLKGIPETYANLHFMVHAALQWQQTFCPQAQYIMKTDDDTVVHLERLVFWTNLDFDVELEENNPATCFGKVLVNRWPIRGKYSKWYVPEEVYPNKAYPNYLNGCTYMCSALAIKRILDTCSRINAVNMEDVLFTGIVAQEANVSRVDKPWHFWLGGKFDQQTYCADGFPYTFAVFDHIYSIELFYNLYDKLKSMKCKWNL